MDELEQTLDIGSTNPEAILGDQTMDFSPVAKQRRNSSNLNGDFDESTRQLLRSRLMVTAASVLLFLLAIKSMAIAIEGIRISDFLTRLTAVIVLSTTWIYLRRNHDVSLPKLRILEIVVFAIPVAEALLVLVQEVQKRVVADQLGEVPTMFTMISFAIGIFIAIYGMYVPANWRRTLMVTGVAAICPMLVASIHSPMIDGVSWSDYPGFAAPMMTFVMACVATNAAHVVNTVRRQAAEAKQYGQYQLVEEIGQGGMGVVYKAKHRMLKRPAAIKLIRNEVAENRDVTSEFEREVQLSASLTHWNTVQIYDYGRTDDGEFFYVMECLDGETLEQRIRRGKMSVAETIDVISQVCNGLEEAHDKGMIHRDIKPANVFLATVGGQQGVVKILDFGLAAMKSEVSRLQKVSGTPSYISPEQIRAGVIDSRSDIYALGCVIFECLAGRHLFSGNSVNELIKQHLNQPPAVDRLPESAAELAGIIERCVDKDPEMRFPDVAALRNALSAAK